MPIKPPRRCPCGFTVPADQLCRCQLKRQQERKRTYDQQRPSASARGYGPEWRKARAEFLRLNPTCRMPGCGAPATVVDHIEPHRGNQALFWNKANWQPLCAPCHNSHKQIQERRS